MKFLSMCHTLQIPSITTKLCKNKNVTSAKMWTIVKEKNVEGKAIVNREESSWIKKP